MRLGRIPVLLRGSIDKTFYEKKPNYWWMYSIKANSNALLCHKIHEQIHANTESVVNIVIYRFSQAWTWIFLELVLNPRQGKILQCLKISFVCSADYPSLGIKFGDIFRHVPQLQIPSNLASVNLLWWSKTCIKISLVFFLSGF